MACDSILSQTARSGLPSDNQLINCHRTLGQGQICETGGKRIFTKYPESIKNVKIYLNKIGRLAQVCDNYCCKLLGRCLVCENLLSQKSRFNRSCETHQKMHHQDYHKIAGKDEMCETVWPPPAADLSFAWLNYPLPQDLPVLSRLPSLREAKRSFLLLHEVKEPLRGCGLDRQKTCGFLWLSQAKDFQVSTKPMFQINPCFKKSCAYEKNT